MVRPTRGEREALMNRVSRRRFIQSTAGLSVASLAGSAWASQAPAGAKASPAPRPQKLSPANIGGGGRVERDFYGDWLKQSVSSKAFRLGR